MPPPKPVLPTAPAMPTPVEPVPESELANLLFLATGNQCQRDIPVTFKTLREVTNFDSMGLITTQLSQDECETTCYGIEGCAFYEYGDGQCKFVTEWPYEQE